MKRLLPIAALALMGCMDERPAGAPTPPAPGVQCSADAAQGFVGRKYSAALGKQIQRRTGAKALRVLPPGAVMTMDFRTDRVDVTLDAKGVVTAVRCG